MSVIWVIECDEPGVDRRDFVSAPTHADAVKELVRVGFERLLKDDVPYQSEPLGVMDSRGRTWSAMPFAGTPASILRSGIAEILGEIEAKGAE